MVYNKRKEIDNINEHHEKDYDHDNGNQQEKKKEQPQPQPQQQQQKKQCILSFKDVEPAEIYFWKVFRNIVIFKHIFSNFKNKQYGYYDLIGCDEIFFLNGKSNSMEIIIDNIKSNNNHQIIRNECNIIEIIHKFKKNDEKTKSFYNLLFSRYSSTSTSTSTSPTQQSSTIRLDENIDKWVKRMIRNVNCTALDQFIKFFKIDSEVIKKVIEIHIKPSFFGNTTYDKLKIYNYLKSINSIPTSHKLLPFISTDLQMFLSFDNKFKKLIKSYKRLIESTNLQERMEQQEQQGKFKIHHNSKKYYEKLNQKILELNEIQTSQFTNDQLNSTIHNLLNHTTSTSITTTTTTNTTNLTLIYTERNHNNNNNQNHNNSNNKINLKDIIKKYYKSIYLFFYFTVKPENKGVFRKGLSYYLNFKKERVDKMYERVVNKWNGSSFDHKLFFQSILKDINIEKNEKLELISNVLDNKYVKTFREYDNHIFFKAVFSSNDIELIDYFLKKIKQLQLNQIPEITNYPSISKLIGDYCHLIDKKEILDFYFQNYRDESLLFNHQNESCKYIQLKLIEHYEYLMGSIGNRCKLDFICWYKNLNFLDRLNRAILKPSVYSIDFGSSISSDFKWLIVFEGLINLNINNNNENSIINFLSNAQSKQPLDLEILGSSFNPYTSKMLTFIKFLFNNISKESIETKLKVINLKTDENFEEVNSKIEFTTTLTTTTTTNLLSPKKSEDLGYLTIGKTESFNFTISIRTLLICLYNLDRVDDIIYLFDKLPEVLFNPDYFSIFTKEHCLYSISSSYYLELFINYFIENLNDTTNYLYHCLCIASEKGYTQIFKNIISSDQNSKYLLKIQTKSNQSSLFDSKLLNDIVDKSISSLNFELSNLLIDFIDFSANDQITLKMKILKLKYINM
ncbi:hypothetical protein ACTFIW_002844 [Dictyostelium discoideum]